MRVGWPCGITADVQAFETTVSESRPMLGSFVLLSVSEGTLESQKGSCVWLTLLNAWHRNSDIATWALQNIATQ